jgi:hypothetical protein
MSMTAISVSIARGVAGTKISDFTVGSLAVGANDIELRFNTTDGQGKNVNRQDIKLALDQIWRIIANNPQTPAGTWLFPGLTGP